MSVFGVDFGNLNSTVSVARRRGIDVIINEVSKRETNTCVSFGSAEEGRMIGEKGADMKIRNIKNTANHLKTMVGVKYDTDEWRSEMNHTMFTSKAGEDGFVVVEVMYNGEMRTFRPEQLIAMMLGKLRSYADREAAEEVGAKPGSVPKVVDCVLSCPPYYSAFQRKLLLQATEMAGLNCLTLVTEGTAVALQYGIFKSEDLPEKEEDGVVVQFCDMGHSATYITSVKFWNGNLKVLSHVVDRSLGCRDFDMLLASHFRKEIQAKYKMDVFEQKKAKLRLLAGCEKMRYTLSANPVVSLNVECIMDDVDVSFSKYTRDEFEELCAPLWAKMQTLVDTAVTGLNGVKPKSVELVGGGSYMPKVKKILEEAFKQPVMTTLNASEAVAKGCGIIGAILSPRFHVKSFQVQDALVDAIKIGYLSTASTDPSPVSFISAINKETVLYEKNSGFPKVFDLSFDRSQDFDLYTYYGEPCPNVANVNGSLLLGQWTFSDLPVAKTLQGEPEPEKPVKVAVRFRLNSSGIVEVDSASVTEYYEVQEEVTKKVEKKDGDKDDKKDETEKVKVTKKKSRKIDIVVTPKFLHGLTSGQVEDMTKEEAKMSNADRLLAETIDAKNALEGYSYDFKNKVSEGGVLHEFLEAKEREAFNAACTEAADWVYGDGENATKEEYVKKLTELRKPGDEATMRMKLRDELPFTFKDAEKSVLGQMDEANRLLGSETHIEKAKLEEIVQKGTEALEFFKKEKQALEATAKHITPTVTVAQVLGKGNDVVNFARPIFATPKPTPPKEEKKKEEAAPAEASSPKAEQPASPQAGMDVD
eukprot:TRINITY_DN1161_c12_g1_i2.p1 TRINITY_DN1161_c12_g1~~TRINITY_DN1161_c12_g1_i2.p1  ORF type:complete len:815 (+),score=322.45 TRINITY_DN1161_c12_g1_i2:44-2488(+)